MGCRAFVVLRYDDYHAGLGPESEDKDAIERDFLAAFAECEVPLTLGVVPDYERRGLLKDDRAKLDALLGHLRSGRVEAALHGFTHQSLAPSGSRDSEFAGQPRSSQTERLRTGKAMLEDWLGVPVTSFIPPWNTYDEDTAAALSDLGFTVLSADLSGCAVGPPLRALHHTCGLGELPRTLRQVGGSESDAVVVCMFHHFSFRESRHPLARRYAQLGLDGLRRLLAWCRGRPGVRMATLGQVAARLGDALSDGRVDEARERWQLVFGWRRVPVVGRLLRWMWAPRGFLPPGAMAPVNRWLRALPAPGRRESRGRRATL